MRMDRRLGQAIPGGKPESSQRDALVVQYQGC